MKLLALVTCDDSVLAFLNAVAKEAGFAVEQSTDGTFLVTSEVCPEDYTDDPSHTPYIWSRVREWVQLISGCLVVLQQGRIAFKNLMRETPSGDREWVAITGSARLVAPSPTSDGTPHATASAWLTAATQEPKVALVLQEWSQPPTWFSLYRIYEVIRSDLGGVQQLGGVSKGKVEGVAAAANHAAVSGARGRHAVSKGSPPANPPDLREAIRTMRAWSEGWLRTKQR